MFKVFFSIFSSPVTRWQGELLWSRIDRLLSCVFPSVRACVCPSMRSSVNNFFNRYLLLNHWLDFNQTTEIILGLFSFKVVQMVSVHCISRSQELKIDFLTENLKSLLVSNHWTNFNIIFQKCFFGNPLPRLFKPFWFVKNTWPQGAGLFSLYISV